MKKRELILDFTSLLDIIMIILFLVLGSVSESAATAQDEAQTAKEQAIARMKQIEELTAQVEELSDKLAAQSDDADKLSEQIEAAQKSYDELSVRYDALLGDYEYLKLISDYGADDSKVYEAVIERTGKVVLYCNSDKNDDGKDVAVFSIYTDAGEEGFVLSGTFEVEHDTAMSSQERADYKARSITAATQFLLDVLREDESSMLWFSIYYDYDDLNISSFDMEVIEAAIDNLELRFDKRCYYIRFKTRRNENE